MSSTLTHTFMAEDTMKKFNFNNYILEYVKTFAQGPDPLNFYYLDFPIKGISVRKNYPNLIHKTKTKDKFITLIKYIKENNYQNDKLVMSFLYGIMCHYFLDYNVHPFVYYYTRIFKKEDKLTYKYNGLHAEMEVNIDLYFIKSKLNIYPTHFKFYKYTFNISKFNNNLIKTLNYTYKKVYNIDNFSKIYYKSIKHMKRINRFFRYDKIGIKKMVYKLLDKITPENFVKIEPLSYNNKINLNYLNKEKNTWENIFNNKKYNYSFNELYLKSIDECTYAIKEVNKYLYENYSCNILDKIFKNKSYITGDNCNLNKKFKLYE